MVLLTPAHELRHDPRVTAVVPPKVVTDIAVAVRTYANFLGGDYIVEQKQPDPRAALTAGSIASELSSIGFTTGATAPGAAVAMIRGDLAFYVLPSSRLPLLIHPAFETVFSDIQSFPDVITSSSLRFHYDKSLLSFPMISQGQHLVNFGIPLGFTQINGISRFVGWLESTLTDMLSMGSAGYQAHGLPSDETEAEVLAKARIGQGRFRMD